MAVKTTTEQIPFTVGTCRYSVMQSDEPVASLSVVFDVNHSNGQECAPLGHGAMLDRASVHFAWMADSATWKTTFTHCTRADGKPLTDAQRKRVYSEAQAAAEIRYPQPSIAELSESFGDRITNELTDAHAEHNKRLAEIRVGQTMGRDYILGLVAERR